MAARRNFTVSRGPRIGGRYPLAGRFFRSEYEYQQERARQLGFDSYGNERGAKERAATNSDFKATLTRVRSHLGLSGRPKESQRDIELQLIALQDKGERSNWRDKSANGPLAQILVMTGQRNTSDTWNVGDTPQWARKRRSA